jgi:nicotinamidase/pyrazinamidase
VPSHAIEKPCLLIIDMVKDSFDENKHFPITPLARPIIEPINRLSKAFRKENWPVVFATDAFKREDFIFTGRMRPHSIEGTKGAEVIDELDRKKKDLWLPKPRLSAFFRTGLDPWLKEKDITLCAVAGITTPFCVLTTALDAICCDFKAVILEDCTAAGSKETHKQTLNIYRKSALYPLLRVTSSSHLLSELKNKTSGVRPKA